MINGKLLALVAMVGTIGIVVGWTTDTQQPSEEGIPARTVADYLHALIEANRTFYTQHIVDRHFYRTGFNLSNCLTPPGSPRYTHSKNHDHVSCHGQPVTFPGLCPTLDGDRTGPPTASSG